MKEYWILIVEVLAVGLLFCAALAGVWLGLLLMALWGAVCLTYVVS